MYALPKEKEITQPVAVKIIETISRDKLTYEQAIEALGLAMDMLGKLQIDYSSLASRSEKGTF